MELGEGMKVIFLDFDGVINNWDCFDGVDYDNVKFLLQIIKLTGAKIVATSSKKYSFQRDVGIDYKDTSFFEYVCILRNYGIEITDITQYVNGNRELEILAYLEEHPEIEQFLILDDDFIIESMKEHQVFLDLYNGIGEEHIIPSVNILNGNLGFYPPNFDSNETLEERNVRINKYHSKKTKKKFDFYE